MPFASEWGCSLSHVHRRERMAGKVQGDDEGGCGVGFEGTDTWAPWRNLGFREIQVTENGRDI